MPLPGRAGLLSCYCRLEGLNPASSFTLGLGAFPTAVRESAQSAPRAAAHPRQEKGTSSPPTHTSGTLGRSPSPLAP